MWSLLDLVLFTVSLFVGATVLLFAQKKRQRREREAILRHRKNVQEQVEKERIKAENVMKPQGPYLAYIRGKEEKQSGLIILSARYGNLMEDYLVEKNEQSNNNIKVVIDVTDALQLLVGGSRLHLSDGTKTKIQGFYDPCPQEPKNLEVKYKFNNKVHKVTIHDTSPLSLPRPFHCSNEKKDKLN